MIDIKLIRENPELVKENIKKKFQEEKLHIIDEVRKQDIEWRNQKTRIDNLRHERNKISKEISELKKSGKEKEAARKRLAAQTKKELEKAKKLAVEKKKREAQEQKKREQQKAIKKVNDA